MPDWPPWLLRGAGVRSPRGRLRRRGGQPLLSARCGVRTKKRVFLRPLVGESMRRRHECVRNATDKARTNAAGVPERKTWKSACTTRGARIRTAWATCALPTLPEIQQHRMPLLLHGTIKWWRPTASPSRRRAGRRGRMFLDAKHRYTKSASSLRRLLPQEMPHHVSPAATLREPTWTGGCRMHHSRADRLTSIVRAGTRSIPHGRPHRRSIRCIVSDVST